MNLAVCFYGINLPSRDLMDSATNLFGAGSHCVSVFKDSSSSPELSLQNVAFKKRTAEIANFMEFDVCIAIDSSSTTLDNLFLVNVIEHNVLYYVSGFCRSVCYSTGVSPKIFYANSITFDRVAEFYTGLAYIDPHWMRDDSIEERFYYHIKNLMIKAECINFENSSLFIRAT